MGTGAGSHFLAGGEISNFNPPGKGQRKAPTVSYSNGRKAQALSGAATLEERTAHLCTESGGDYMPWSIRSPFRRLPWAFRHFSQQ